MRDKEASPDGDVIITVRRQWNSPLRADYRLADVRRPHWSQVSGGVDAPSPYPMLSAYVQCDEMLAGELAHAGVHGPCPHSIKVCVTQVDNDRATYRRLAALAGPKPQRTERTRL
jgi:hypothetical protein